MPIKQSCKLNDICLKRAISNTVYGKRCLEFRKAKQKYNAFQKYYANNNKINTGENIPIFSREKNQKHNGFQNV